MKYAEVAENVKRLVDEPPSQDEFIFELLLAYGSPKSGVTLLKKGTRNLSKVPGEVLWKNKVYFKPMENDLFAAIEEMKAAKLTKTNKPRFLIVTDFKQLLSVDMKTDDTLDIELPELETNYHFFLPWAGMEKTKLSNENPADIKAAEKMAKLFDAIRQDNRVRSPRGTEFRQWATRHLAEYLQKGFLMDDERLKNPGGWDYFDELLERIREIRASEKRFYQKVRDLFALSSDYADDPRAANLFFSEVQNKLLYAVIHHTAAELVVDRGWGQPVHCSNL